MLPRFLKFFYYCTIVAAFCSNDCRQSNNNSYSTRCRISPTGARSINDDRHRWTIRGTWIRLLTLVTGRTIWLNYQRVQRIFMFDESETVDFSDIMNGPISIPYSRKNRMSAKKGHGRSNRIGTRLDLKATTGTTFVAKSRYYQKETEISRETSALTNHIKRRFVQQCW
jgi:hypothetical protein